MTLAPIARLAEYVVHKAVTWGPVVLVEQTGGGDRGKALAARRSAERSPAASPPPSGVPSSRAPAPVFAPRRGSTVGGASWRAATVLVALLSLSGCTTAPLPDAASAPIRTPVPSVGTSTVTPEEQGASVLPDAEPAPKASEERTGPASEAALPEGLHALVDGHNDLAQDRINLVFAAHAAPPAENWQGYARDMLTWDGPVPVTIDGRPTTVQDDVSTLAWGPFALEPLRSRRDLVNVWYLDQPAPDRNGFVEVAQEVPVDLPGLVLVVMSWDTEGPAYALPPERVPPALPQGDEPWFGTVTMPMMLPEQERSLALDSGVLTHELGHAIYDLPDTYMLAMYGEDAVTGPVSYPGCAPDQATAEEWFGDLVGTVDPFFEEWRAAYDHHGIPIEDWYAAMMRDMIRVSFVPVGCVGPQGERVRSSESSLMHRNYTVPVLDAAERRWAERVLDAWEQRPAKAPASEARP